MEHRFTVLRPPETRPTPRSILERGRRKLNTMYERTERDDRPEAHRGQPIDHQTGAHAWYAVDPGDTHDKGEESLCVGEAA